MARDGGKDGGGELSRKVRDCQLGVGEETRGVCWLRVQGGGTAATGGTAKKVVQ